MHNWKDPDYAARIIGHISAKIASAQLILRPYPHFIVRDLMPDDFYRLAQRFCAKETSYAYPIPNGNGEARFPATKSFKNSPDLTEEAHAFWNMFRSTVCATVNRVGSEKIRDHIGRYFQWLRHRGFIDIQASNPVLVDSALQVSSRENSAVGSHPHSLYELLTSLIYMPEDDRMDHTGTWLDKFKGKLLVTSRRTCSISLWPPLWSVESAAKLMTYNVVPSNLASPVYQVQYKPNALLAILNTPHSLHSQRTGHSEKRHILLFASLIERSQWAPRFRNTRGFALYPDELA